MRHAATHALLTRNDVIIVASRLLHLRPRHRRGLLRPACSRWSAGRSWLRDTLLRSLVDIQYERNDLDFHRGTFRVRGDTVEIFPRLRGGARHPHRVLRRRGRADPRVRPAARHRPRRAGQGRHLPRQPLRDGAGDRASGAIDGIREELRERLQRAARRRTSCWRRSGWSSAPCSTWRCWSRWASAPGIENYSRQLSGRTPGEPPPCLIDYFPQGLPARHRRVATRPSRRSAPCTAATARARRRWSSFGFRLPIGARQPAAQVRGVRGASCRQAIFVSATPAEYELQKARRAWWWSRSSAPPACVDPEVEVRPVGTQVDDLLGEVRTRAEAGERVLVTTLTKRMAEDLTEYYTDVGRHACRYLHSDIDTLERIAHHPRPAQGRVRRAGRHQPAARGARHPRGVAGGDPRRRQGGLPALPSVSLIQTIGRAARNVNGRVIMYADSMTDSMKRAIDETNRRRAIQQRLQRRARHHPAVGEADHHRPRHGRLRGRPHHRARWRPTAPSTSPRRSRASSRSWSRRCRRAAEELEFEKAAQLRDRILALKDLALGVTRKSVGAKGLLGSAANLGGERDGTRARPAPGPGHAAAALAPAPGALRRAALASSTCAHGQAGTPPAWT